jgi:hypothetical protein
MLQSATRATFARVNLAVPIWLVRQMLPSKIASTAVA